MTAGTPLGQPQQPYFQQPYAEQYGQQQPGPQYGQQQPQFDQRQPQFHQQQPQYSQPQAQYGQPQGQYTPTTAPQQPYGQQQPQSPQYQTQQPAYPSPVAQEKGMITTQQPGQTPQMHVPGNRLNALNKPLDAAGRRAFSYGFCGCFDDCGTCCMSYWCPCMVHQNIKSRLESLRNTGAPHPSGGDYVGGDCAIWTLLMAVLGIGCVLDIGLRSSVRGRYNIDGNGCTDCLAACYCIPCIQVQETREIAAEEDVVRGQVPQGLQKY